jgi:hypothetical protein
MMIKPLLAIVAVVVAVTMLPDPLVALADGGTSQSAPAVPGDTAPIILPLSMCTNLRWVNGPGTDGGHYVGSCPHLAWVPAQGPAGGYYTWRKGSCVRWTAPRGLEGGYYVATCGPTVRWIPTFGPAGGQADYATSASPIQRTTKPVATQTEATAAPSWGFDWGSAGIVAATVFGAVALGVVAATELRRRRTARPPSAVTR